MSSTEVTLIPVDSLYAPGISLMARSLFCIVDADRAALEGLSWAATVTYGEIEDHLTKLQRQSSSSKTRLGAHLSTADHLRFCAGWIIMQCSPGTGIMRAVGLISVRQIGAGLFEIGYWVGGDARGQQVGTRAVELLMIELKELFPINMHAKVRARPWEENKASQSVLVSNGFEYVCTLFGECFYERSIHP